MFIRTYLDRFLCPPPEQHAIDRDNGLVRLGKLADEVRRANDPEQLASALGGFRSLLSGLGAWRELERRTWSLLGLFRWDTSFQVAHREGLFWSGAAAGTDPRFDELIQVIEDNPLVCGLSRGLAALQQAQLCVLKGLPPDFYQAVADWQRAWKDLPGAVFSQGWEGCACLYFLPWLGHSRHWPPRLAGKSNPQSDAAFLASWLRSCSITSLLQDRREQLASACSSLNSWFEDPAVDVLEELIAEFTTDNPHENDQTKKRNVRNTTRRGDGVHMLSAALTAYHQYDNGQVKVTEPIGNNELARGAKVNPSTASDFFKKKFGSYGRYRDMCRVPARLGARLAVLNDEWEKILALSDRAAEVASRGY